MPLFFFELTDRVFLPVVLILLGSGKDSYRVFVTTWILDEIITQIKAMIGWGKGLVNYFLEFFHIVVNISPFFSFNN